MATDYSSTAQEEQLASAPAASGAVAPPQGGDGISLLDLVTVLAERKHVILWIAATFTVVAIIVSLVLPKRYTATVTLLPPQQNSSVGSALASQVNNFSGMAALGALGLKNPNEMFVAMLKSRTVEDGMVQNFGLVQEYRKKYLSDARQTFEKRASIDGSGKDGLIHIAIQDVDPNRAAALANGYVDQFRKLSEHLAITEASQRRLFFERQLEEEKDKLADAEEALKKTQQSTGMFALDAQARALIESAASLRAQITAKEVQIQSLQTFATNENSQLVEAQQELTSLRAQLAKLAGSDDTSDTSLIVPKGKVPQAGLEYVRKIRDVKYHETIFDILARQFEIAKLDEAKEGSLVQVVDAAVPPDRKSAPKRTQIVVVAALAGVFIGVFVVVLQVGFERLRESPEDALKLSRLRRALFSRTH